MDGRVSSLGVATLVVVLGAVPARAQGPGRHDPQGDAPSDVHQDARDAYDAWVASQGDDDEREAPPDDLEDGGEEDDERLAPVPHGEAPDLEGDDEALPTQPAAILPGGGTRAQPLPPPPEETEEPASRGPVAEPPPSGPASPESPAAAAAPL